MKTLCRRKKFYAAAIILPAILAAALLGPWPVYRDPEVTAAVLEDAREIWSDSLSGMEIQSGRLRAGWAAADLTPERPVELAGYGARRGRAARGIQDRLHVKAVALDTGGKPVLLLGADLLIMPDSLMKPVREELERDPGLDGNRILAAASHTHSAPNPWDNRLAALVTGGAADPQYLDFLVRRFVGAAREALADLSPAQWAQGYVDAGCHVANRARKEQPVDGRLEYLYLLREDGSDCYLVNFSAHATILGRSNLLVSADWPGRLQSHLEQEESTMAVYISGAAGSCRPVTRPADESLVGKTREEGRQYPGMEGGRTPERAARALAYGQSLAGMIHADSRNLLFRQQAELGAARARLPLPPYQVRISPSWRLSPLLPRLLGIPRYTDVQVIRIGDLLLFGMGAECSAEISRHQKSFARQRGLKLWIAAFAADYRGYLSPDRYYDRVDSQGRLPYETGFMSWCGPHAEYYFTTIIQDAIRHVPERPQI